MRDAKAAARVAIALLAVPLLSGCLVRTAADVATLPVKAGSQAVDWTTTSQDEADRNRGRALRKQEQREAKERRKAEKRDRERAARDWDD